MIANEFRKHISSFFGVETQERDPEQSAIEAGIIGAANNHKGLVKTAEMHLDLLENIKKSNIPDCTMENFTICLHPNVSEEDVVKAADEFFEKKGYSPKKIIGMRHYYSAIQGAFCIIITKCSSGKCFVSLQDASGYNRLLAAE